MPIASPPVQRKRGPAAGRPRTFDPAGVLRNALDVFWEKGYEATSLDDLTAAMNLSRSSFYACFGSKHAVLMASVELYSNEAFASLSAAAQAAPDPVAGARAVLAGIADTTGDQRGCFFVNAINELVPLDREMADFSQRHIARMSGLLAVLLERAGLAPEQAQARAGALFALALGIVVLRKAGTPAAQLQALLDQCDPLLPGATGS